VLVVEVVGGRWVPGGCRCGWGLVVEMVLVLVLVLGVLVVLVVGCMLLVRRVVRERVVQLRRCSGRWLGGECGGRGDDGRSVGSGGDGGGPRLQRL
jgi:hypothetical protein